MINSGLQIYQVIEIVLIHKIQIDLLLVFGIVKFNDQHYAQRMILRGLLINLNKKIQTPNYLQVQK